MNLSIPHPLNFNLQKRDLCKALSFLFLLSLTAATYAQCTGCTQTVTSNVAITVSSGQTVCINYTGTYNNNITVSGGTLCIGPNVTWSGGNINMNGATIINNYGIASVTLNLGAGYTLNNYGRYTGGMNQNGGAITVYSGGTFAPSSYNANGGTLTNNVGGTVTLGSITFPSGYTFTNNGTVSIGAFTVNSGATVILTGTSQTLSGSVANNGTLTIAGPATISGSLQQNSGAVSNFSGGVTTTGNVSNNGTINLSGSLNIGGSYSDNSGATIKASGAGGSCNAVHISGSNSGGSGTFNGNGYGLTVSPPPSNTSSMTSGAGAPPAAPTQQPIALTATISAMTASGSFTSPSAAISGYIVLRYTGTAASSDNPVNGTAYTVGSTVGSSTVAAMVTSSSTGSKTFTDPIPAGNCGKNVYYRIFSYNGSGSCIIFDLTSPLTGSVAITAATAAIAASGATTFCSGHSVTYTASGGSSYSWSSGVSSAAITAGTAGTYTVTVTNTIGCTATASSTVVVHTNPTVTISSNSPVCAGTALQLTSVASGSSSYTYSWSGPLSFTATIADTTIAAAATTRAGTYSLTVTDDNTCTASATMSASVVTCLSVSGSIFDDANGNGTVDGTDSLTSHGQVLYAILADTNSKVLAVSPVSSAGAFTVGNVLPNTTGMSLAINTSSPAVGTASPGYLWPSSWTGTLGQYGTGNPAGSGVYSNINEKVPVRFASSNITNVRLGYDRMPTTTPHSYTISYPHLNSSMNLTAAAGTTIFSGSDPEDGAIGQGKPFAVTSLSYMAGNTLYYDLNGNGQLETSEKINAADTLTNFDATKLYISFTGHGSTSAAFSFSVVDAAGKLNQAPSVYRVSWADALPITLIYFGADKYENDKANITWSTAMEINNQFFSIERSADALTWASIGQVQGAGNSTDQKNYSLIDSKPLPGTNYYRLKQVDYDGKFTYSDIVEVEFPMSSVTVSALCVYPNPLRKNSLLNVKFTNGTTNIKDVTITNTGGATVFQTTMPELQPHQLFYLSFIPGMYMVTVEDDNNKRYSSQVVVVGN
jgi:hypothetical protein